MNPLTQPPAAARRAVFDRIGLPSSFLERHLLQHGGTRSISGTRWSNSQKNRASLNRARSTLSFPCRITASPAAFVSVFSTARKCGASFPLRRILHREVKLLMVAHHRHGQHLFQAVRDKPSQTLPGSPSAISRHQAASPCPPAWLIFAPAARLQRRASNLVQRFTNPLPPHTPRPPPPWLHPAQQPSYSFQPSSIFTGLLAMQHAMSMHVTSRSPSSRQTPPAPPPEPSSATIQRTSSSHKPVRPGPDPAACSSPNRFQPSILGSSVTALLRSPNALHGHYRRC